jgi:DNA repair protein RecN (Recombination protein N)
VLLEILIEQFALIDNVRLQVSGGLNVLTGETGAGKSIVLDAVGAVLGGRTSSDVIRTGRERAVVEAVFDLSARPEKVAQLRDIGIEVGDDGLLIARREINRSGRPFARINGRTVTIGMLREATDGLVDLHGQHEHQGLLQVEKHVDLLDQYGGSLLRLERHSIDLLDSFAGASILGLRVELAGVVTELRRVDGELRSLIGDDRDRARKEDLLRFQLQELENARLREGEEEELEAERRVLAHAEKLKQTAAESYGLLYEGGQRQLPANDLLGKVKSGLQDAVRHDSSLAPALDLVEEALVRVVEVSHLLAEYRDRLDDDPQRLAQVEKRLDLIVQLKRKYGDSVREMLAYRDQVKEELQRLERSEELIGQLKAEEVKLGRRVEALAEGLTEARRRAARELGARVARELNDLGMPKARFEAAVSVPPGATYKDAGPKGWDQVEFLFSPNPGEPVKPLTKIVSGGEMSRIMLALKATLARVDGVPTLVFDEVDAGISGRAAQAVAEKLAVIAGDRQVLCVTHLPQVAAMADVHVLIAKEADGDRTVTTVQRLDETGRAEEIARMISGSEVTQLTLESARELIRRAAGLKEGLRTA